MAPLAMPSQLTITKETMMMASLVAEPLNGTPVYLSSHGLGCIL